MSTSKLLDKYLSQSDRVQAANNARKEYGRFQAQLNRDLKKVKDKMKHLSLKGMPVEIQEDVLRKAAAPLVAAAQARAPVMKDRKEAIVSYKDGRTYYYLPGNLKLSIQEIRFRRRAGSVTGKKGIRGGGVLFFGPKVAKRRGRSGKTYRYGSSKNRVDAFYAHFVEYGTRNMDATPFMRPAYQSTRRKVIKIATYETAKLVRRWAERNKVR